MSTESYLTGEGFDTEFCEWVPVEKRRLGKVSGRLVPATRFDRGDCSEIRFAFKGHLSTGTNLDMGFVDRETYARWKTHMENWGHDISGIIN